MLYESTSISLHLTQEEVAAPQHVRGGDHERA
jgi:hypothetical protein